MKNLDKDEKNKYNLEGNLLYSYDKQFSKYENGRLLSRVVSQYGPKMKKFGNGRAMINEKYEDTTSLYFQF